MTTRLNGHKFLTCSCSDLLVCPCGHSLKLLSQHHSSEGSSDSSQAHQPAFIHWNVKRDRLLCHLQTKLSLIKTKDITQRPNPELSTKAKATIQVIVCILAKPSTFFHENLFHREGSFITPDVRTQETED